MNYKPFHVSSFMVVQLYKPNPRNTGFAFSCDIGSANQKGEPCVYVRRLDNFLGITIRRLALFLKTQRIQKLLFLSNLTRLRLGDWSMRLKNIQSFLHITPMKTIKLKFLLSLGRDKGDLMLFLLALLGTPPTSLGLGWRCQKLIACLSFLGLPCKRFMPSVWLKTKKLSRESEEKSFNSF